MCIAIACDEFNGQPHSPADDLCPECRAHENKMAWDCDLFAEVDADAIDLELDLEDDTGDWQVLALDRYGDRLINPNY